MWRSLTSLEENKQGPALNLSLKDKAKEVVKDVDVEKITTDTGFESIIDILDSVYKKDEKTYQETYLAYKQFEEFKRPKEMAIKDYIVKFESLPF